MVNILLMKVGMTPRLRLDLLYSRHIGSVTSSWLGRTSPRLITLRPIVYVKKACRPSILEDRPNSRSSPLHLNDAKHCRGNIAQTDCVHQPALRASDALHVAVNDSVGEAVINSSGRKSSRRDRMPAMLCKNSARSCSSGGASSDGPSKIVSGTTVAVTPSGACYVQRR